MFLDFKCYFWKRTSLSAFPVQFSYELSSAFFITANYLTCFGMNLVITKNVIELIHALT